MGVLNVVAAITLIVLLLTFLSFVDFITCPVCRDIPVLRYICDGCGGDGKVSVLRYIFLDIEIVPIENGVLPSSSKETPPATAKPSPTPFSTEKANAVVHTGVEKATSSFTLAGDLVGQDDGGNGNGLQNVTLYLQLAGENPIDMDKVGIAYIDKYVYKESLVLDDSASDTSHTSIDTNSPGTWDYAFVKDQSGSRGNNNNMLDANEKVKVFVWLPAAAGNGNGYVTSNNWFQIEIKTEQGGVLPIKKTVPGAIDERMVLYS